MAIHMAQPAREALQPWLDLVKENNVRILREDLESLFRDAKNRYPDIVWVTQAHKGDDENAREVENEVWGHQALVYARATSNFHALYLDLPSDTPRSAPFRRRFKTLRDHDHVDFVRDLQYLYTAKASSVPGNLGLKTSPSLDYHSFIPPSIHWVLLSNSLIFLWKSCQFSDVHISLQATNHIGGSNSPTEPTIFHCHRFILSSRSPHFHDLIAGSIGVDRDKTPQITLPSPLFTRDSLHFILGYIYSGTLIEWRNNLLTAFSIFRGSLYLALPGLEELILTEIAVKILHGLFHAPLSDIAYTQLVSGKWTKMTEMGCRCRECAHLAPLVLQFALDEDINNHILERGARRTLVGLFGEGWFTQELSVLPSHITDSILANVQEIITPQNALPLLFAAEKALLTYSDSMETWHGRVRAMIISVRQSVSQALCTSPNACFGADVWGKIVHDNRDSDAQPLPGKKIEAQVGWAVQALLEGSDPSNWFDIYQMLIALTNSLTQSSSLKHALSSSNNPIVARLESAKLELLELSSKMSLSSHKPQYSSTPQTQETMPNHVNYPTTIMGRQMSTLSLDYSFISFQDSGSKEPTEAADLNSYASSLGPVNTISLYSYASSRTVSTDYGILYTRRALSQETIKNRDAERSITRKHSYDSFGSQAL